MDLRESRHIYVSVCEVIQRIAEIRPEKGVAVPMLWSEKMALVIVLHSPHRNTSQIRLVVSHSPLTRPS